VKFLTGRGEKIILAPPLFFSVVFLRSFLNYHVIKRGLEMISLGDPPTAFARQLIVLLFSLLCMVLLLPEIRAQGAIDYTGTGGRHTIEGRIYFPSGRKADGGIKITLETASAGTLTVYSDFNGTFSFRNLSGGSYTVVIPGTADYEGVREAVYIDDPGSSSMRGNSVSASSPARFIIVPIYLMAKRVNTAKPTVVDAALAALPKAAVDLYQKALESLRASDHKKAISELEAAISIYPEFPRALNELGVQYLVVGQIGKAVTALESAVRLAPEDFVPRLNYGIALLQKKEFKTAEDQLRIALQKNDGAATVHMYLGIALLHQQNAKAGNEARYSEAEKELQRAIQLGGDQIATAHYYLAGIYWRNGQHRRAADELETYLKLAPNAPDADRTRATIKDLRARGD
jgi:Tfp pilus assembly protein PilF